MSDNTPAPEPTLDELAATLFRPDDTPAPKAAASVESAEEKTPTAEEEKKPDPAAERVSARIAAAKRAELQAKREREFTRAEKAAIAQQKKDLDAREAKLKLIEEDPVRFFEEYKADPKAFLEKLAGEHKPERQLEKRVETLSKRLEDIDQEKEQRDAAFAAQSRKAQADAQWKAASDAFISMVNENADKYPHLVAEYTEQEAAEEVFKALHEVIGQDREGKPVSRGEAYRRQYGAYPDNETIADFVDQRAKARAEARAKAGWRCRQQQQVTDADPPSEGQNSGEKPAARPVKGSSPRTLTSRASSEKATAPKPWTQEAADEESIRIIESSFRKTG